MSITYLSLDEPVRVRMVEELDADIANDAFYKSPRLTESGLEQWPSLLREACEAHDDAWLAAQLRDRGCIATH